MTTTVELISATDTVVFYPTPDVNGYVYDNKTLDKWYALAKPKGKVNKRPNAHGAYNLGQVFTDAHDPILVGQYFGTSPVDALRARERLSALFSDGLSITMRVTDELRATTREVWIMDFFAPFQYGFDHFPLDLALTAPDPRRYGPTVSASDTLPSASGGLYWNLGTAPSTLYFDWGLAGALGQVSFTNTGVATTFPLISVGGPGAFGSGFRVTEIETGRELTYERETGTGDVIVFDSRTQRATISAGGGDVTGGLSSRDWFEIPQGQTRRYQINPLGSVTGAPTITVAAAAAYL